MNNTELVKLNFTDGKISSAIVKNNGFAEKLESKEYVIAMNPYNTVDIFRNSNMKNLEERFDLLTKNTKSK